jgi:hypothetical protein
LARHGLARVPAIYWAVGGFMLLLLAYFGGKAGAGNAAQARLMQYG